MAKCGAYALYRDQNSYFVGHLACKSTLKCATCARYRARVLVAAFMRIASSKVFLKPVFLTVTLNNKAMKTFKSETHFRHVVLQALRRSLASLSSLTYVCVPEKGRLKGRLHLHLLVLHCSVRKARDAVRRSTAYSFNHGRLVRDATVADYIAKYAAKGRNRMTSSRDVVKAVEDVKHQCSLIAVKPDDMPLDVWLDALRSYGYLI